MLPSTAVGSLAEWERAAVWQVMGWWSWAALTPLVLLVARRGIAMRPAVKVVALHTVNGVAAAALGAALATAARWAALGGFRPPHTLVQAIGRSVVQDWAFHFLIYGAIVGVFYALRAGRLEGQLTAARVDALTARLRPHFLYNALNTISMLVLEDPKAANRMIARLSELLRQAFDRSEEKEVAMEDECRLLEHYVSIQQMRFGERLRVRFLVDPSTLRARVPPLILQPLVENAIAHGTDLGVNGRNETRTVSIEVEAQRSRQRLHLIVRDDGPGFSSGFTSTQGTGLASTRARLAELYGSAYRLELTNVPSGGAAVRIEIPFNPDASADR